MRHWFVIGILMALLPWQPAAGQTKTHRWPGDMCEYTVRYDARKISPKAMADTAELLASQVNAMPISPFVAAPGDIAKLDPAKFERDCAAKAAKVRSYELLPIAELPTFRDGLAGQIEDACAFGGAQMRGYSDPSALRRYRRASPHCDRFVDALEGKSDMTALWRERIREECANNASPAECRKRNQAKGETSNGEAWKRLYLTSFGWGNCATNHTTFNNEDGERHDELGQKLSKTFLKTYRVKESCEEP